MEDLPAAKRVTIPAPLRWGMLLYPDANPLDVAGPFAVFSRLPEVSAQLFSLQPGLLVLTGGMTVLAPQGIDGMAALDIVCVPGGLGVSPLMEDERLLRWLSAQAATARMVSSVCTGSLLLGAAGLLRGKRAGGHRLSLEMLTALGAMAEDLPVVRDGALWTCGGAAAGIEMAFQMAQSLVGEGPVGRLRMRLQIDSHPSGAPGEPSPHGSAFESESRPHQDRRWQVVRRAAQRLGL